MIECLPRSLCSWDYRVLGLPGGEAAVEFDGFFEQGVILVSGDRLEAVKHGLFSGRWSLSERGNVVAEAVKPSAFLRRFEIAAPTLRLDLEPDGPFTRGFVLSNSGRTVARLRPEHPLTRRARIETVAEVPARLLLFSFWLAALSWRRAASS
jgi:hypothetical protein